MAVVVLPTPLQARAGGAERVPVEGGTAAEALRELESRCPELRGWILDERGRLRVWETADRGASWAARGTGLPDEGAYLTVLRQAFCDDGGDPLGLWFGTESGTVFGSVDAGASWFLAAEHLPKVTSVQAS